MNTIPKTEDRKNDEELQKLKRLDQYLRAHHSIGVDDVEITETRGYWRLKKPCDESCRNPIHGCIGNSVRIQHTISFAPHRREKGRFVSKYEVWDAIRRTSHEIQQRL